MVEERHRSSCNRPISPLQGLGMWNDGKYHISVSLWTTTLCVNFIVAIGKWNVSKLLNKSIIKQYEFHMKDFNSKATNIRIKMQQKEMLIYTDYSMQKFRFTCLSWHQIKLQYKHWINAYHVNYYIMNEAYYLLLIIESLYICIGMNCHWPGS